MENIKNCFSFIKSKLQSEMDMRKDEQYEIIERRRQIYYFSKFELDLQELKNIYLKISTIKINLLKNVMIMLKIFCENSLSFSQNESENEKCILIFTLFFIQFYSLYSYNNKLTFEDFFNEDLENMFRNYRISILDNFKYKIFCTAFFLEAEKEFLNSDYQSLIKYYQYYNPEIINDKCKIKQNVYSQVNNVDLLIKSLQKNVIVPLIQATERVVEMVLSLDNDDKKDQNNQIINCPNDLRSDSLSNESNLSESKTSTSIGKGKNNKRSFKRLLCELTRLETSLEERERMLLISNKLHRLTDIIISRSNDKYYFIQDLVCYIVEVNNELIKTLPESNIIQEDCNMRFVILSKNVYNFAVEIYFALYNLYNINLNTFVYMFRKRYFLKFHENLIESVLLVFKLLNEEFINNNSIEIEFLLEKFVEKLYKKWDIGIIEKGKDLISYSQK